MEAITLARPYARAAFELARDSATLDTWSQQLAVAAGVALDPSVAALRNDPRVEPAQLVALHLPEGVAADSAFGHFLGQLAEHGRLDLLADIAALYEDFKRESEAVLKVRVTSAKPLDEAERDKLRDALKRRYQREIDLDTAVDAALLAGAVVDTGEQVIDGSARGRLAQLATALTH